MTDVAGDDWEAVLDAKAKGRWTRTKVRTNLYGSATGHLHKGGDGTRQ